MKTDKSAEEILIEKLFDAIDIFTGNREVHTPVLVERITKLSKEYAAQQLSEYKEVIKELLPLAEDGYKLALKNGSHQEFLLDDREVIERAKKLIK